METSMLEQGQTVEKYAVERLLGQGGMAQVYLVRHTTLGTPHALKILTHASEGVKRRLLLEGRTQARLKHANIVAVTDVLDLGGTVGLVLEYVSGASLEELLTRQALTVAQIDQLAEGLFRGVGFAHDHGLVHRDLKPANILLGIEGRRLVPKVADFGLVKASDAISHTRTGVAMGTPRYMAPEQIRDAKNVDHRADVFSLGVILYELVTGAEAFAPDTDDLLAVFNAVADGIYRPVLDLRPDAPPRMVTAIQRALETDPERRPQSIAELRGIWYGTERRDDVGWELEGLGLSPLSTGQETLAEPEVRGSQPTSEETIFVPETPAPSARSQSDTPDPTSTDAWLEQHRPKRRLWLPALLGLGALAIAATATVVFLSSLSTDQPAKHPTKTAPTQVQPTPPTREAPLQPPTPAPTPTVIPAPTRQPIAPTPTVLPAPPRPRPTTTTTTTATPESPDPRSPDRPTPDARVPGTPAAPLHRATPETPTPETPTPETRTPESPPSETPDPRTPNATFSITNARGYLRSSGHDHPPGPVPPGTYTVLAHFGDLPVTVREHLVVSAGDHVAVTCKPLFKLCDVELRR